MPIPVTYIFLTDEHAETNGATFQKMYQANPLMQALLTHFCTTLSVK